MRSPHTHGTAGHTMSLSRIDPADRRAITAAAFTAGLLIAQQVASRAVRDAIFLSAFRVKSLPLVMAASAVAAVAGAEALSRLQARRSPSRVVPAAAAVSAILFGVWWTLGLVFPRPAAVLLYLHVAAFGGALVSGFWSLVNERFDPYTARRAMGAIGTGAAAGGVAGGALAWLASRVLPLPATVLGLVVLGALCASALAQARAREAHALVAPPAPLRVTVLVRNPYLRSIALVVLLGAVAEAIFDFLFKAEAADRFAAGSLLGAFALFHAGISVLGLVFQVSLSRVALRGLGIAGTIGLRPAATAAGAILGVFVPGLAAATLVRGAFESLTNSLFRSGYELLYTPLPEAEKRRVKAIVDVGVDKAGALAGSAAVALALAMTPLAATPVLFAVAAFVSLALVLLTQSLQRGYVQTLAQSLILGRVRLDAEDIVDHATQATLADTSLVDRGTLLRQIEELRGSQADTLVASTVASDPVPSDSLVREPPASDALLQRIAWARSGDPALVRRALRHGSELDPALVACILPLLSSELLFAEVVRVLRRAAPKVTGQLVDALLDPDGDPVVRRRIPRVLKACPTPRSALGLRTAVDDSSFEVRAAATAALAALHERSNVVQVSREEVLERVRRELDSGEPVDRQLPQLFALLSLMLERGPLQIAWTAMKAQDRALRGTALEYLSNVLPADVFPRIRSCFGASSVPAPSSHRPMEQVTEELRASSIGLRIEQPPWREGGES
jgi:AAA family ATP:ADP antiporter